MSTARRPFERHSSLPSTNDRAIALAEAGAAPWTAVLAETQTAGRGRQGRRWLSSPGNLHLSVVLDAEAAPPRALGLLVGVAAAEAVAGWLPTPPGLALKWPNDLMVEGRKLGGVLVEAGSRPDGSPWAVAGIGINLVAHPEADRPTVSLAALGLRPPAPDALAAAILERLAAWTARTRRGGLAGVLAAWQRHAHPPGTPLAVRLPNGPLHGRYAGLAADGSLMLALDDGSLRCVVAGDVSVGA